MSQSSFLPHEASSASKGKNKNLARCSQNEKLKNTY